MTDILASDVAGWASCLFSAFLRLAGAIPFLPQRRHLQDALDVSICVSASASLVPRVESREQNPHVNASGSSMSQTSFSGTSLFQVFPYSHTSSHIFFLLKKSLNLNNIK